MPVDPFRLVSVLTLPQDQQLLMLPLVPPVKLAITQMLLSRLILLATPTVKPLSRDQNKIFLQETLAIQPEETLASLVLA